MAWPRGKRRTQGPDCAALIRALGSVRVVAVAAGVSPRAVQFWRRGVKIPGIDTVQRIIERLWPLTAGGSILSGVSTEAGMPCGVGEYTLRAAAGLPCYEAVADGE